MNQKLINYLLSPVRYLSIPVMNEDASISKVTFDLRDKIDIKQLNDYFNKFDHEETT